MAREGNKGNRGNKGDGTGLTNKTGINPGSNVTVTLGSPDSNTNAYTEVDEARDANMDALNELISKTTSSCESFEEAVSDVSSFVVSALESYANDTPMAANISDYLSVFLDTGYKTRVDSYDNAISKCNTTLDYC